MLNQGVSEEVARGCLNLSTTAPYTCPRKALVSPWYALGLGALPWYTENAVEIPEHQLHI